MPHFKEVTKKFYKECSFNYPRNTVEVVNPQSDLLELEKKSVTTT